MDVAAVMDGLAAALVAGGACTVAHAWPTEAAKVGEGIVGYPSGEMTLGITFGRGADRATFPVWVMCGIASDKATRTKVAALVTAASDVKTSIEAYAGTWDSVHVRPCVIEGFEPIGQSRQVVVRWDCDVIA